MSRKRKAPPARADEQAGPAELPQPVNVVDGIPDRREGTPAWKYVLIGGVFAAWLAFLIYCAAAGRL